MENNNQTPLEYFYESLDFLELRPMEWKGIEQNFEIAKEMEKQKDVKYNEMLEMLKKCRTQLIFCTLLDKSGQCSEMVEEIEQLIK
jgi:hypothetical protein